MKYSLAVVILLLSVGMVIWGQYPYLGVSALGLAWALKR